MVGHWYSSARLPRWQRWWRHSSTTATTPASAWSSEYLSSDFDAYIAELEAAWATARRLIIVEVYILGDDDIGRRVEHALSAAAARGVTVLLAVDGIGSDNWIAQRAPWLSRQGVQVRVYHPPPWHMLHFSLANRQRLAVMWAWLRYLNRRNHRKICLVDGRVAWVGSMNLVRVHSRALMGNSAWRDTVARVSGDDLTWLQQAVLLTWRRSWRVLGERLYPSLPRRWPDLAVPATSLVRLNDGLRRRRRLYRDLLQRINTARERVWLANAYFVPHVRLLRALGKAAQRGADVRIIVPAHSDVWFMPYVAATFTHVLAQHGVRLYLYQPCMLHSKNMLIDQWLCVGSSNLNSRSLRHDLEADVVLTQGTSRQQFADMFIQDLAQAHEVTAPHHRPAWWVLCLGYLFLFLRRWI